MKVLIIEDETALLYALAAELKTVGAQVLTSADGKEGFAQIKEHKPDLVLLDILLPGLHGIDLLEKKNKDQEIKDIPVIIISNSGSDETVEKAKKLGVKEYLIKTDYTLEEIINKIRENIKN
ncbi:MAG: hypothetical protein ACD_48C00690G0003 [uncultured bacterium]|nr:MAG: hypothetical protein ACD_48C00690G0003 [uncultured bacterium]